MLSGTIFRHFAKEHFFRFLFIASLLWRSKRLGHIMRDETRIMTSHKATCKRMSALVCSIVRRVNLQRDCLTLASRCSVEHASQHTKSLRSTIALHKRQELATRKEQGQSRVIYSRHAATRIPFPRGRKRQLVVHHANSSLQFGLVACVGPKSQRSKLALPAHLAAA